jgi:2-polyprenyl-3-methyl-5-hydroxy-6-metoxy-1,4-benzoquinol methylase
MSGAGSGAMSGAGNTRPACWCGNDRLGPFSPEYLKCTACGTLVLRDMPAVDVTDVGADEAGLYGREYWFKHQEQDVGFPNITRRAVTDLPERCVHWLRAILQYKLPPARTLELGAAHGGFVSILRWAGFDATGLELSPWIADFARQTFGVPMLQGPVERQPLEPGSLDVVMMMDVVEHLPDPVGTLRHCARLLKPDGLLVVQTPEFPEELDLQQMHASGAAFVAHLRPQEHLWLFSRRASVELMARVGCGAPRFEPAMFSQYDQFFFAPASPDGVVPEPHAPDAVRRALETTPGGRMIGAMLDLADARDYYAGECAARLKVIEVLDAEVKRLHGSP